jgi:CRP-like cAMP-binding protein
VSQTVEQILSRCQLFAEVDAARRRGLAEISLIRKFTKGQLIFRQGEECPGVYVVDSGMVRVFKTAPTGKEHVLHMVGSGHTFAEVAAIGGFACPANAESIASTTCALLPLDRFRKMMATDHQLCLEMMTGMSFWVRHLISLMEDIVLRDAIGRIARFLLEEAPEQDGTVKLPGLKRHVASHLNLTSETFSRTLGRLIEAGLILEQDNNRVELREPERLRAIAEGLFPEI